MQPVSRAGKDAIQLLGLMIALARKNEKITQQELAERVGIKCLIVAKIEKGDPSVAIGCFIECAVVLGIPLFGTTERNVSNMTHLLGHMLPLMPDRIRGKVVVYDDF